MDLNGGGDGCGWGHDGQHGQHSENQRKQIVPFNILSSLEAPFFMRIRIITVVLCGIEETFSSK